MLANKHIIFIIDELNLPKLNMEHVDFQTVTEKTMASIERAISVWKNAGGIKATHECVSILSFINSEKAFSNALGINISHMYGTLSINRCCILSDKNYPMTVDSKIYSIENAPVIPDDTFYKQLDILVKIYSSYTHMCPDNDPIKYFKSTPEELLQCKHYIYSEHTYTKEKEAVIIGSNEAGVYKNIGVCLNVILKPFKDFTDFENDAVTEFIVPIDMGTGPKDIFCVSNKLEVVGFNSGEKKVNRTTTLHMAIATVFNYRLLNIVYEKYRKDNLPNESKDIIKGQNI